ncbi:hypothetical protein KKE26_06295 [bacterium]|nr:hypothetical protein [bacterium]MBU1753317.1 hypothetical protein [bacterium]
MSTISYSAEKNSLKAEIYDIIPIKPVRKGQFRLWVDQNNVDICAISINCFEDVSKDFEYYYKEKAIHALCGKYKDRLSSSEEFARQKQIEIELEEQKWQER